MGLKEGGKPVQVHRDKEVEGRQASSRERGNWKRHDRRGVELCSKKDLKAPVQVQALVVVLVPVVVLDGE